ncbi:hypothetical protein PROFUN_05012 [Planoprotostelium fungivorum]|uniref:Armadillo repeat-containing protein 7 n=1 Tax=Planoprotostelium fungivorum TaxID=1890364 RepID=A0A2P6NS59_9EUKA|nr:hypothetical protein PROFUN_05012 [Planoprotostelium fungivorum]
MTEGDKMFERYNKADEEYRETPFFSTMDAIKERQGKFKRGRFGHIQALVTEFVDSEKMSEKLQVLANLANFSYDPVNYPILRQLQVIDLFLDCLDETDVSLVEYGMGGLCNLCDDPENATIILQNDGVPLIISCLSSPNENTVTSAMYTLRTLCQYLQAKRGERDLMILQKKYSKSANPKLSNIATIFLQDFSWVENEAKR